MNRGDGQFVQGLCRENNKLRSFRLLINNVKNLPEFVIHSRPPGRHKS